MDFALKFPYVLIRRHTKTSRKLLIIHKDSKKHRHTPKNGVTSCVCPSSLKNKKPLKWSISDIAVLSITHIKQVEGSYS